MLSVCIDALIANEEQGGAELLNDTIKPLADLLIHLELKDDSDVQA